MRHPIDLLTGNGECSRRRSRLIHPVRRGLRIAARGGSAPTVPVEGRFACELLWGNAGPLRSRHHRCPAKRGLRMFGVWLRCNPLWICRVRCGLRLRIATVGKLRQCGWSQWHEARVAISRIGKRLREIRSAIIDPLFDVVPCTTDSGSALWICPTASILFVTRIIGHGRSNDHNRIVRSCGAHSSGFGWRLSGNDAETSERKPREEHSNGESGSQRLWLRHGFHPSMPNVIFSVSPLCSVAYWQFRE